jgi:alpha-acetolactate decarboxylase
MATNELYQFSILNALMDGVCTHGIDTATLLTHGNHGLGTFRHMDGEMIVVDGTVYHMKADGSITEADPNVAVPFASVTRFAPTVERITHVTSKDDFAAFLSVLLPDARNLFLAVRIDGVFDALNARTVRGQAYPGQKLAELGQGQLVREYANVRGTLIGFRSPGFSQGVSVAGEHIHFISEDRTCGGHVLEFSARDVKVGVSVISTVHLELPKDAEFNKAKLESNDAGIRAVEG